MNRKARRKLMVQARGKLDVTEDHILRIKMDGVRVPLVQLDKRWKVSGYTLEQLYEAWLKGGANEEA